MSIAVPGGTIRAAAITVGCVKIHRGAMGIKRASGGYCGCRRVASAVIVLTVSGCRGSPTTIATPLVPTASTPTVWQLTGTIRTDGGRLLGGALVTIPDGVNAGRYTTSNGDGSYVFGRGLNQDTFTLQVTAPGHASAAQTVTLTGNLTVNFELPKMGLRLADLRFAGSLIGVDTGQEGLLGFRGMGVNKGDGCAGGIYGTTQFYVPGRIANVSIRWTLPSSTVVRPDDNFEYTGCCITPEQLAWAYITLFTNATVSCS